MGCCLWGSWLSREGRCVHVMIPSRQSCVSQIVSNLFLFQLTFIVESLRHCDGKLEESCARSSARERPERESTFRRRLHQLYAKVPRCSLWRYDACRDVDLTYLFIFSASAGRALRSSQTHCGWPIVREVWWICWCTALVLETLEPH